MIQVENSCDIPKHIVWEYQINELKRLQKEIDVNIMAQNNMTNLSFFGNTRDSQMQHEYHKRIIESNQAKIKQIIEEL